MNDLRNAITTAQESGDLELIKYFSSLGDSGKLDYASKNAGEAIDKIKALKNDRMAYLSEDLTGADNNIISTAYYLTRTNDLKALATDVDDVAVRQLTASDINAGIINRQQEINEWANNNKLDTLFFLQVLFICLTFISALFFMNHMGIISNYLLNLCIVLITAFAVFVLISRARYTMVRRDSRYWSKLRYPHLHTPSKKDNTKCPGQEEPEPAPVFIKKTVCTPTTQELSGDTANEYLWSSFLGGST